MFGQYVVFELLKCEASLLEEGDLPCASETDIETFIERLSYEIWVKEEK